MGESQHHTALSVADIVARTGGTAFPGDAADVMIRSITIDSRKCTDGSLFVALPGATADGHDFVAAAAGNGAAAMLVTRRCDAAQAAGRGVVQIVVEDCQQALNDLAIMGRILHQQAGGRLVGITGSVGKTGSKEMLAHILSRMGGCHASQASFNNHVGVPLTLAALPAAAAFAVQELGMNAAGEIAALTLMAGPDIALITRIADSHAGFFSSTAEIAAAKAEIFDGLCGLRVAVLNRDDEFYDALCHRARLAGAERVISFGTHNTADLRLVASVPVEATPVAGGQDVQAMNAGKALRFRLGMAAPHWALNALAVLGVVAGLGLDVDTAAAHLADFGDLPGRGARHHGLIDGKAVMLIDDSYNAGPTSMAAAFAGLTEAPPQIMVLSDMLELGTGTTAAHDALIAQIAALKPRAVIALGPEMTRMAQQLEDDHPAIGCQAAADSEAAIRLLEAVLTENDTIFIKGSNGSGAHRVAAGLLARLTPSSPPSGLRKGASHAA